jgi:hypothetical protein
MGDAVWVLGGLGALVLVPCVAGWLLGRVTGTEGSGR